MSCYRCLPAKDFVLSHTHDHELFWILHLPGLPRVPQNGADGPIPQEEKTW